MKFSSGLFHRTALVVSESVAKHEPLLGRCGYEVVRAESVEQALVMCRQELPHLILADSKLPDGDPRPIFDAMRENYLTRKVAIFVNLLDKEHGTLSMVSSRKFSGVIDNAPPKAFMSRVREVSRDLLTPPPYFLESQKSGIDKASKVTFRAAVIGRLEKTFALKSPVRLGAFGKVKLKAVDTGAVSPELPVLHNLAVGDHFLCLLPLRRLQDQFKVAVEGLPKVKISATGDAKTIRRPKPKRVLVQHPEASKFTLIEKKLASHAIKTEHARDLKQMTALYQRDPNYFGAIYADDIFRSEDKSLWIDSYHSQDAATRPGMIVGTIDQAPPSQGQVSFVQKPIEPDDLVEMLKGLIDDSETPPQGVEVAGAEGKILPVAFQLPMELAGLDEGGGVLTSRYQVAHGVDASLRNERVLQIWGGRSRIRSVASVASPGAGSMWHTRFVHQLDMPKRDYWDLVFGAIRPTEGKGDDAQPRAPVSVEVINHFIQSTYEVIEYYTDELPNLGKPHLRQNDSDVPGFISGTTTIDGETARGFCGFSADAEFISHMAFRVAGIPQKFARKDEALLVEVMTDLCDQIFGKARIFLHAAGFSFDVALPKVEVGGSPEVAGYSGNVMIVPFTMEDTKFSLSVCFQESNS